MCMINHVASAMDVSLIMGGRFGVEACETPEPICCMAFSSSYVSNDRVGCQLAIYRKSLPHHTQQEDRHDTSTFSTACRA